MATPLTTAEAIAAASSPPARRTSPARVATASLVGTSLEFYDHFIYGTAAALVFPKIFFPQSDPFVATLLSLLSYGIAFVARPVGAALFGSLGDRLGRRFVLVTTLLLMGLSTFAIGLLPTYAQVGVLAPVMLAVLRFLQGLALGGEWGGAALMVSEFDKTGRRRGFYGSLVQVASPIGVLLANATFGIVDRVTTDAEFLDWGWRVPFLASLLLVTVGYLIRRTIAESSEFERLQVTGHTAKTPLLDTLRHHWRSVLLAIGVRAGEGVAWYVFSLFLLVYVPTYLGLPKQVALDAVLYGAVAGVFAIPFFGHLADRLGLRRTIALGAVGAIVWSFAFMALLQTRDPALVITAAVVGMICQAALWAPLAAAIPALFDAKVRCTGASLGFQLAGVFGGAIAPSVCVALLKASDGAWWLIPLYVSFGLAIVLLCIFVAGRHGKLS